MSINNPLDNQNYINKDFQTIYPELLDLVKKLTYKWDPSISNESDPGVILLKLNAIIADKNNYNIDKNILECFPDTVTQTSNAYKLFSQLGYNMSWYKAATGKVNVKYTGDAVLAIENDSSSAISFPIDLFTMFCDEDEEIVYTCIESNGAKLNSNGEITSMECIQGVVNSFTVGSSNIIKASALDTKNRIYFPISNIAENGIFITNATKNIAGDYEFKSLDNMWTRVDNLHIQSLNTKCYQFGVDQDNGSCYVEFPIDVTNLIGEGLFINYIQTLGEDGNIAANRMTKFYTDYNINLPGGETLNISSKSKVSNASSIVNGSNPESIDEAFINYKKVVGTFDTLVTLRDYLNYITRDDYELVSNGVVSDRTMDIQDSYKVMTTYNGIDKVNTVINPEKIGGENVEPMSAFDLKTYFLKFSSFPLFTSDSDYNSIISTLKGSYDRSFEFLEGDSRNNSQTLGTPETIQNIYEDSKSVQHNFIEKEYNRPLIFKNKFTLDLTIIPKVQITPNTREEIQRNIYEALYKSLYSRNISFGEELTYETIYDICNKADNRVKAVAVNSIEYKPYAVMYITKEYAEGLADEVKTDINYKTEGIYDIPLATELKEYKGNIEDKIDIRKEVALEILAKNILKGTTPLYDADTTFTYDYNVDKSIRQNEIEKVSTYTEVEFNNLINSNNVSTVEQKMLDNESIVFYAPNLIEKTQYSVSIKYIYYTTDVYSEGVYEDYLPANHDIMLKRGQVLYTFWKNEDSNDAPYMYAKYGEGDIIHTTSNLYAINNSEAGVDNWAILKGRLEAAGYNGTGQIIGTLNDDISDLDKTILSATKVLTIKELNKAKLTDPNNYCYWITNDIEKDPNGKEVYKLTLSYDVPDDNTLVANFSNGEVYVYDGDTKLDSQSTIDVSNITGNLYIGRPETKYINYIDESGNELSQDVVEYKFYKITNDAKLKENEGYIYANTIKSTGEIKNNVAMAGSLYTDLESHFNKQETHKKPYTVDWHNINFPETKYEYPIPNQPGITNYHIGVMFEEGAIRKSIELDSTIFKSQVLDIIAFDDKSNQIVPSSYNTELQSTSGGNLILWISGLDAGTYKVILQLTPQGNVNTVISGTINGALNDSKFVNGKALLIYRNNEAPTFDSNDEGTSSFSYQLRTNEYFLYTDEKYQELHFLGMGTTIKLYRKNSEMSSYLTYAYENVTGNPAPTWTENTYYELKNGVYELLSSEPENWDSTYSTYYTRRIRIKPISLPVPTTDYAEIVTGGIDSMKSDMWYNFRCRGEKLPNGEFIHTGGNLLEFTENRLIILGEGTRVRVSIDPVGTTYDGIAIYWNDYENLKIKYDGVYVGATPDEGEIIYSKQSNVLSNYTIQYLPPEEGASWQTLPESIDSRLSWNAYTLLDINAGANVPQPLYLEHKQRFVLHTKDGKDGKDVLLGYNDGTLEGYETTGVGELVLSYITPPEEGASTGALRITDKITQDKINLQTSATINLSGGQNIDVTAKVEGEIKYLDFYSYTNTALKDNPQGYTLIEEDDGSLLYTADKEDFGNNSLQLSTSLFPFNDHIMPIEILASEPIDITKFEILVDGNVATPIGYDKPEDLYLGGKLKNKIYYVKLNLSRGNYSNTIEIKVSTLGWPKGQSIRIYPLFVYDYMRNSTDSDYKGFSCVEETLIKKISKLDINNDFNYIYQPPADTKITNPLSPSSYFNNNHFCNKFTISQISKIDIQTLNVRS